MSDYRPDASEPYMNPRQLAYFRGLLLAWRARILAESQTTLDGLRDAGGGVGDEIDRANLESAHALDFRDRDRARRLLGKIDVALQRIADGSYGYCDETGEPIGIPRLLARPMTTLSVDAQNRREWRQRQQRRR